MNLPFYISKRYFFAGSRKRNAVNIISWISLGGIGLGTAALIVVLSVFNGFEDLINSLYNTFNPDIKITAVEGKFFQLDESLSAQISEIEGLNKVSYSLEEKCLVRYDEKEYVAVIKGVDSNYREVSKITAGIVQGDYFNENNPINEVIIGKGVSYYLSLPVSRQQQQALVFIPKPGKYLQDIDKAFYQDYISPTGVFAIQTDFDSKYIIAPLSFTQNLTQRTSQYSSIEIKVNENVKEQEIVSSLKDLLGPAFNVQTREEQQSFLFKIMKTERLAVFTIFTFILLIAVFNMVGSLTMMMLEKKEQIKTLWNLGLKSQQITRIFLFNGLLIGLVGGIAGLLLGLLICYGQAEYQWIKLGTEGSFIINAYPVKIKASDIALTFVIVSILSSISSWIPARRMAKKFTDYIA